MLNKVNISNGNNIEIFCEGDNSVKKTKRVILKKNEPKAFFVNCVNSSKKKNTRRNSTNKKKSSRNTSNTISPKYNKPQSIIQALKNNDDGAFPHPIIDGLYLGFTSEMQPPIKTKTGKPNPSRRSAINRREKQRDYIRMMLKKDPTKERIHNLMIANSTKNTSLPNIIKELQKNNPKKKLSILIEEAKKIQHERVSNLKLQSIQSSPTSEINNNSLADSPSPDSYAMSLSNRRRKNGGSKRSQKKRFRKKRKTKKKKNKKRRKKTKQKNINAKR